jgi:flagellar biogenesis protein FliO
MGGVVQHKIGGVMLVAESAAMQSRQEWALLCGSVAAVMLLIVVIEYLTGGEDEQ